MFWLIVSLIAIFWFSIALTAFHNDEKDKEGKK